jgi:hypothetical protein
MVISQKKKIESTCHHRNEITRFLDQAYDNSRQKLQKVDQEMPLVHDLHVTIEDILKKIENYLIKVRRLIF